MGGSSEGLTAPRKRPRRCVGCGREEPKTKLLRVVRAPDGSIAVNERGKAPGRGAYVCADRACIAMARKKKALSRALKQPVEPEIYDRLEELCDGGSD